MRERNWQLLILCSSIILYITWGIIAKDGKISLLLGVFGGMGTGFTMFIYFMKSEDRKSDRENAQLEKENKYRKTIECSNCGRKHFFTPVKGVCMVEFLIDKTCDNCKCKLQINRSEKQ